MDKVKVKDLKLQVRIQKDSEGMYYGQVFKPAVVDDKNLLYYMNCDLENGWNTVSTNCATIWGCKLEIKLWKRKHFIHRFEI